jgi:hypothetical protein
MSDTTMKITEVGSVGADHAALTERGDDAGEDLIRMGEGVPPMFRLHRPGRQHRPSGERP